MIRNSITIKKYAAGIISFLLGASAMAQPVLTQISTPTMQPLYGVSVVVSGTDTLGVAVGLSVIARGTSVNNWQTVGPDTAGVLTTVHFPTMTTGYIGGSGMTSGTTYLIKSTDGGMTWSNIAYPDSFLTVRKLFFTDANTGYLVAQDTNVYKTVNGGASWSKYTISDGMGGQYQWIDVYFADAMNGYALAAKTINSADITSAISKTTDGGTTWSAPTALNNSDPIGLSALFFVDDNTGYVTGTVHANSTPVNTFRTTNGGSTFTGLKDTINATNTSLYFLDAATGFFAGDNGTITYTTDSAKTLTDISPGGVSNTFNSISFAKGSSAGYVVGDNGYIFKIDAGNVSITSVTAVTAAAFASAISVYPNPCTGTFTVNTGQAAFCQVNVLNALGQQVHTQAAVGTATVSLPNMKAGVYYVQVQSAQGSTVQKLVVQE